jgi:hypothetical protein
MTDETPDLIPAQQEVDLVSVQRDDTWLGQLGSREVVVGSYGVLELLRELTVEVDNGLPELLDRPLPAARPDQAPAVPSTRRRNGTRAAAALVLATGLVSMTGVAAAVTGDALSPYRHVLSVVRGGDAAHPHAGARAAALDLRVATLRGSIASGQIAHAQAKIDALRASALDLPPNRRLGVSRHLDALERQLAGASAREDARLQHRQGLGAPPTSGGSPAGGNGQGNGSTSSGKSSGGTVKHPTAGQGSHGKSSNAGGNRSGGSSVNPSTSNNGAAPSSHPTSGTKDSAASKDWTGLNDAEPTTPAKESAVQGDGGDNSQK